MLSITERFKLYGAGAWSKSGTVTLTHDSNGDRSFAVSIDAAIYYSAVNCRASGTFTLNNIPRSSTLSVSAAALGMASTLTVNRKLDSYTHTITYKCGTASGTICTKSSATGVQWTPPLDLARQAPNTTGVEIVYTITTYSGSTTIGASTATATHSIPAALAPTISVSVNDPTGVFAHFGAYVQGKSTLEITVTAAGSYGSTVRAVSTSVDGQTFTDDSFSIDYIKGTGELTLTAKVTDSRGRTGTYSTTISVLAYEAPRILDFAVRRCNYNSTSNPSGAYLAVDFDAVVCSLNDKNTARYAIRYKKTTETEYTEEVLTTFDGVYAAFGISSVFPADTASSYDVQMVLTDYFGEVDKSAVGPSIRKMWSHHKSGNGFAFGKVAEKEGVLDSVWPVEAPSFIGDWSGVSLGENFIQIKDFKFCWGQMKVKYSATTAASGSSYYGDSTSISGGTFGVEFSNAPTINLTVRQGTTSMLEVEAVDVSTTGINTVRIHRANSYTDNSGVLVDYIAVGV